MRPIPLLAQFALLLLWLGGSVLFAAAVAPALFAVLPTRTLAGAVVGRVLPVIFYSGMLIGVVVIVLDLLGREGWSWRGAAPGGVVMTVASAIAQLVIGPRIERLRSDIGGVLESLAADDPRRAAFGRLHGMSVAWMGLAMLAAAVAAFLIARELRKP